MATQEHQNTGRAAFAVWDERIAPVFDVSQRLLLIDTADGDIVAEEEVRLSATDEPAARGRALAELGVRTLVCGAISRPLLAQVRAMGIEVVPFVAGERRPVIMAWLQGALGDPRFAMPGCGNRQRRRGRGGNRRGRGGGAGAGGDCICPGCGHRTSHLRGVPCNQRSCPQCGGAMIRET